VDDATPADGRLPLLPGSLAIDTGVADGTLADQLGDQRIGNPDIGAVEYPRSARVWIGVKNKADNGLRVDLLAEAFVNGVAAGASVLTNLTTGLPGGFANAFFYTVLLPPVDAPSGRRLTLASARPAGRGEYGTARPGTTGSPWTAPARMPAAASAQPPRAKPPLSLRFGLIPLACGALQPKRRLEYSGSCRSHGPTRRLGPEHTGAFEVSRRTRISPEPAVPRMNEDRHWPRSSSSSRRRSGADAPSVAGPSQSPGSRSGA
jgi:hypothetical protein